MKVLCVGSLNLDYTYQVDHFVRPGETLAARARSVHCGGKGLNQSIAAAKAGLQVWHAGLVGTGGAPLLDALQRYGVDTGLIRALDQPCGHPVIQVTEAGENCILLYGGTNTCLTESFVDETLCRFAPGDVLLLQNEVNGIPYLIRQAVRRGLRVAFNAAPMAPEVADYPLELLSWLVINEGEGAALAGTQAPADILDRLAQRCPDTQLLLTLGAGGSVCRAGGETWSCGVFPVRPVDTTAAGDTFLGYYLGALLAGAPIPEALRLSSAASALCIQRRGAADAIPLLEEVRAALAAGSLGEMGKGVSL